VPVTLAANDTVAPGATLVVVGNKLIATMDGVTVTVAVFETVFVADSSATI
jgi:hypothetical protein